MPGKKTIIIKKPKLVSKRTEPISVFAEGPVGGGPDIPTRNLASPNPTEPVPAIPATPKPAAGTTFKFYCYRCGQKLQARKEWAGREVPCSTCGRPIVIPPPLEE